MYNSDYEDSPQIEINMLVWQLIDLFKPYLHAVVATN